MVLLGFVTAADLLPAGEGADVSRAPRLPLSAGGRNRLSKYASNEKLNERSAVGLRSTR